ncbi:DoxX family protein [Brevundimonas bacteroides]|jgi:putative oxidoreductase|uniref:DoxX family protein n=1 Tax=Brevundimonas bacteroides TaxID=74311 RepID=UPI000497A285|nr:DoxX family protein [Brevundimonas bacteroides]
MFEAFERHRPLALSGLRIIAGLMFMQHGTQKIFGFPAPAMGPFDIASQIGIGGVLELVGGALLVIGLFTRPVAFLMSGMMAVAYFQFHAASGGFFPLVNQGELAALYCWVFLYIFFAGPGSVAVDALLKKK